MSNIALKLKYDGSKYHGWQVQKSDVTVAGTIEAALQRLYGCKTHVCGCGRTDAGVHAEVYCANHRPPVNIPPDKLPYAVNSFLPPDIAVLDAMYVPDSFDANLSCVKKEYTYRIVCSRIRDPFLSGRACFYPGELDVQLMREAAAFFTGTHDFAAVRSAGTITKTTVRTVYWYNVEAVNTCFGGMIELRACADGFLYNMARAMAGTLIYVSEGKIAPRDIPELLSGKDRRRAGPTMPPGGLYLTRLWYEGEAGRMFN